MNSGRVPRRQMRVTLVAPKPLTLRYVHVLIFSCSRNIMHASVIVRAFVKVHLCACVKRKAEATDCNDKERERERETNRTHRIVCTEIKVKCRGL